MTSIALVTPWRDHLELAPAYFQAVELAMPDQLVIVDDGSEKPLTFAHTRIDKTGFCGASNAGLKLVETEAVVFLNNDVATLRQGWLQEIRAAVEPGVVVGPLRSDPQYCTVDDVNYPYIDGWCLAMMTDDARRIGGWDETYDTVGLSYYSDTEFSFRARLNGLTLRDLRPGLNHLGGRTGGVDRAAFEESLAVNRELYVAQVREKVAA